MVAKYTYDIYGRRIKKTVNNEVTHFLWEDDNIGLELNGSMQPVRRYVYGVGMDSAEGHFEYAENPSNPFSLDKKGWYSYVKDQVGTIYKTYNHYTQQTSTTTYDSFGNTLNQSGTPKGNLGFQSKYKDPESGLYYYYHRYYNPHNGRFLNEDPIGLNGGLNLYGFVHNDPINYLDPFGLTPDDPIWTEGNLIILCNMYKNTNFGRPKFGKEAEAFQHIYKNSKGYSIPPKFYTSKVWESGKATIPSPIGTGYKGDKKWREYGGSVHTHPWSNPKPGLGPGDPDLMNAGWHKGYPAYILGKWGLWKYKNSKDKGTKVMSWQEICDFCKCKGGWEEGDCK